VEPSLLSFVVILLRNVKMNKTLQSGGSADWLFRKTLQQFVEGVADFLKRSDLPTFHARNQSACLSANPSVTRKMDELRWDTAKMPTGSFQKAMTLVWA